MALTRILVLALLLLGGCAARQAFTDGQALIQTGNIEAGLAKIDEASKLDPHAHEYRQQYVMQRDAALQRLLAMAENARADGQWEAADAVYQRMLGIDPANPRARAGLESLQEEKKQRVLLVEADALLKAGKAEEALLRVRRILSRDSSQREAQLLLRRIEDYSVRSGIGPSLSLAAKQSISLEFRDTSLRTIFEVISKTTGLNFIFDRDVRPDIRTTIFVRNSNVEDVIRFLLVTNQLDRKVLSENTLLIYPNVAAKAREYQELLTKTFYLANADAKVAANLIKTLVKTKDLHIDEKLNMIVMRDTPEAVRMAERLIANQDLAEPEVMLEVEVLEVGTNVMSEIGARWPDQFSYSLEGAAGTAGTLTLPEWNSRNAGLVRLTVTNPFFVINLKNQTGSANILANPRIRVKNKAKAKIHIGDKVPVITTTSTATGFVAQSVTYLDVGLKLEVEPTISLEDEVDIKVSLEVSNITREIQTASGSLTYQLGTRNASTALRLRDGETQVLAGLINDEDRRTVTSVPGIGELPVVGRLFGSHGTNASKTEIVLLITPRIVRSLVRPELHFEQFSSGTEAAIGAPPLVLQNVTLSTIGAPATPGPVQAGAVAPPAVKLGLRGPPPLSAGATFTVGVNLDTSAKLRSALIDFTFDPSRLRFVRAEPGSLLAEAGGNAGFRASAPAGLGRLSINVSSKTDLYGTGELAMLTFQPIGPPSGALSIRVEAASVIDNTGKALAGQPPPPLALSYRP